MGGGKKHGSYKDHTGHWVFAYQKKDDKKWGMVMTLESELRRALEGYSARELRIMPLVCLSVAGMGVCYSLLPDKMIARVIPAAVPKIYSSRHVEIELGELKEADVVIQAAKEGFITACEEGGTRHWFVRQLLMALDPDNKGLTFCNAWMIQNAKARYLIDVLMKGKVLATLEKSGKDVIVPSGQKRKYSVLALKPHDTEENYHCDEIKMTCVDCWDGPWLIGPRYWQDDLLLHLKDYGGVRPLKCYSVGSDLKPRLRTTFAASSFLIENIESRRLYARLEDGTHVASIPEVEPNEDHGERPYGSESKIPRFPPEGIYDDDGFRVYYVKDKSDGTFWQQDSAGRWQSMSNPETMDHIDGRDLDGDDAAPRKKKEHPLRKKVKAKKRGK